MKFIDFKGTKMPALGLGTFSLTGDACVKGVNDAIAMGYRHIDTAEMYKNEDEVGQGIKDNGIDREELFITTKVWHTHLKKDDFIKTTHTSLQKLKMDYIDLLLIHWPNSDVPLQESLEALMELQEQGKTKLIGVSNFTIKMVEEAARIAPVVLNQVEYHPYLDQSRLLDTVRNHGMKLTAYSPIGKGKVMDDEEIKAIGEKYGKSAAQVTLRWHMQQDDVAAIPRSSNSERRQQNLDVFDFELTEDEMQTIFAKRGNERLINPEFAPAWD